MSRKFRAGGAVLLVLLLALTLLPPRARAAGEIYFTAVNDSLLTLAQDTMPVWSGGVLYVPYTVFTGSSGVLGVYGSRSESQNTLTLYNLQQILVFDLRDSTCRNDLTGEALDARAITRSGRIYVPVRTVCSFFGLTYSYNSIPQGGYLVRVCNSAVVLSDAEFIDAAQEMFKRRIREYNQSSGQASSGGSAGQTTPSGGSTTAPDPDEEEPDEEEPEAVYLAFAGEDWAGLSRVLDTLDANGQSALFFFTPQQLEEQQDAVRRILGSGHSLGLIAQGADAAASRRELERGNDYLAAIAHTRTTLALAPAGQRKALEELGWVFWEETLSAQPQDGQSASAFASQVVRQLQGKNRSVRLTLPASSACAQALPTLLRYLANGQLIVTVPRETLL